MVLPHYAGKAGKLVSAPSVGALNMMLAGSQVLRFMEIVLHISGARELAQQRFDYAGGDIQLEVMTCRADCAWAGMLGMGDSVRLPTGSDPRFRRAMEKWQDIRRPRPDDLRVSQRVRARRVAVASQLQRK